MTIHMHVLKGCAPAPLANYLKALGILRLVAQQADAQARGWWDGERFCLLSRLSREELETFFLESYEPTPLIAPWNGGSGFFPKDNRKAILSLIDSRAPRFAPYRRAIKDGELSKGSLKAKPDPKKDKPQVITASFKSWRGPHRNWLEAAIVVDESGKSTYPSLLGTGGNDGRLDFTNNFMQQLTELFDPTTSGGAPRPSTNGLLQDSLWTEPSRELSGAAVGQFQPGSAGGANSSTGFASGNLVNPWDFVLMLEGAILFIARATRKLDPVASSQASAPFSARAHSAGIGTPGQEDSQRGEQWMPLWEQPASFSDLEALLGEARVQLGRRAANRPVDVARAISRLGVARGIDAFERYGYLERNGQSTLAIPLGRIRVHHRPRAYLIDDLASWMDGLQRESRDKNCPGRFAQGERRLADCVFAALTHDHTPERWQAILLAAVDIETLQAAGTGIKAGPIPKLAPEWVITVNDNSAEFRLALALGSAAASHARGSRPVDPVRHHVLPLEQDGRRFKTSEKRLAKDPRVVVSGRDPLRDMAAIVERRLIEGQQTGERRSRLVAAAGCGARLDDLATFLNGAVDYSRLFGLARAFMSLDWGRWRRDLLQNTTSTNGLWEQHPPETWMALRLCCLPWPLAPELDIPADLRIPRLLLAGDSVRASEIACQRLRSTGIRPPIQAGLSDHAITRLWGAALAFPIHRDTALRASKLLSPSMKGPLDA